MPPRPLSRPILQAIEYHLPLYWRPDKWGAWALAATTALYENGNGRERRLAVAADLRTLIDLTRRVWAAGGQPDLSEALRDAPPGLAGLCRRDPCQHPSRPPGASTGRARGGRCFDVLNFRNQSQSK